MSTTTDTDRIERSVVIHAPRERVWRALADAPAFGTWFGANLAGQAFAPGQRTRGPMTYPGYEHVFFDVVVDRIQAQDLLSFHWHPYAVDPDIDYASEQPTLVTFTLADGPDNSTLLKVVESGFDQVPAARRREAFKMNAGGWEAQLQNILRYASQ